MYKTELISGLGSWWTSNSPGCGPGRTLRILEVGEYSLFADWSHPTVVEPLAPLLPTYEMPVAPPHLNVETIDIVPRELTECAPCQRFLLTQKAWLSFWKFNWQFKIRSLISSVSDDNPLTSKAGILTPFSRWGIQGLGAGRTKKLF